MSGGLISAAPIAFAGNVAKRVFDIVFAAIALIATAPIIGLAIVAIRLESRGPALFRQQRMGLNGEPFELLKLRGMYIDARERHPELYSYSETDIESTDRFYFHTHGDPRVTKVGRVLRRFSIDELPNFWNVLRGEMSIVGPRPEIPELAHAYGPALPVLLSVRPGITSPAKALGRDALSLSETIEMDLEYIRTHSLLLDLKTIGRTVAGIVTGGAKVAN